MCLVLRYIIPPPLPACWASCTGWATAQAACWAQKPAAIVTSARRAGTTSALEALEKVPQFCQMPLISSTYWPMVHGSNAEQAALDEEGMQIMRNLGHNMAWILKCIAAGKAAGIEPPKAENTIRTNFIR